MTKILHKRLRWRGVWFIFSILLCVFVKSQTYTCQIVYNDSVTKLPTVSFRFKNEKERNDRLQAHFKSVYKQGYLLAYEIKRERLADTLKEISTLHLGEKIKWTYLKIADKDKSLLSKLKYDAREFSGKPVYYEKYLNLCEKIVAYYENLGYPFANVKLDSTTYAADGLRAKLVVDKFNYFKLDSIVVVGNAKLNKAFLERYLEVFENGAYREKNLKAISGKLKQLAFVQEKQPQQVRLTDKVNKLLLFLDKKNASQFDGIIGLLPDNVTGKTVVTGDLKIKLINGIFRNGETFDLEWRRLQTQTQDFKGRIIYPYLFKTPVGADYSLKIYRKDSSFIDILNNAGLHYYFSGLNYLKAFFKQRNTNLISTSGLEFATTLPTYADISTQSYGLGINFEALDYRFNPHQGFSINAQASIGTRNIRRNAKVNPLAYQNVKLFSNQNQIEGDIHGYIRLRRHNVLHLALQGGGVFGNSTLFRNELFRIGGLKTLRGFDEESIFASTYIIPTIEYRYLFAQNSNLLLFAEGAWYDTYSLGIYQTDTPISFGAGINFETKAGILSLNYGIGNQRGNGFDFRNGKIHFGLTALF